MRFVDTNVLLYSVCADPVDAAKARTAETLLVQDDLTLSVQVLQEFYVQATRSTRTRKLTHEQAVSFISVWRRFPVQDITVAILDAALKTKMRFQVSYWDSAIIEAARAAGCQELLSEDLTDGQDYGGVRFINPFR